MKRLSKTSRANGLTYVMVVAAFVILQALSAGGGLSSTLQGQLVPICAYVVMALSLNLTVGILGELSLGHAGFMSVGAFAGTVAAVSLQAALPSAPVRLLVSMIVGAGCAAVAGFLIGIPVLRLNGDYLAIVTLAFGEIIKSIVNNLYIGMDGVGLHVSFLKNTMTLGEGGRMILNGPMGIPGIQKISTFTAGFLLILVALIIIFNLVNSRAGRAIMAIRDNRIAAESVGIGVTKYKMMAFVLSAALAGAAGTLFAQGQTAVIATKFDFNTSILILVFVVLGGLGRMWGSIIAAAALTILPEALRGFATYRMLVYAIVLILVMLATNNPMLILECSHLGIDFGGLRAVDDFNLTIGRTEIAGLIGPNGAGKTTVFNLLTKVYQPTRGTILLDGMDTSGKTTVQINRMGIARTFQNIRLFSNLSVEDNVKIGLHTQEPYSMLSGILRLPNYWRQEKAAHQRALELLSIFDMQDLAGVKAGALPYGAQRRLEIVRALGTNPSLLLLDEPAAGMNPSETAELMENIVKIRDTFQIAILLIEHDMSLVMGICEGICVLNFGQVIAKGTAEEIQNNPEVIKAYLGTHKEA